jgi:twinkle protein
LKYSDLNLPKNITEQMKIHCPACHATRKNKHDKSLSVNTKTKIFKCHHCGISGWNDGKEYRKPVFKQLELPQIIIDWFKTRGISSAIVASNKIGYGQSFKDQKGIQFPFIKDRQVVNIKHRAKGKKFRQEKDAEKCFYRFDAMKGQEEIIITEGEIDALSIHEVGFSNVVSIPDGAPSQDSKQYTSKFDFIKSAEQYISQAKKIILCMDNDKPGKIAEKELARRIGAEKCFFVEYPEGCKDANDVLVKVGRKELQDIIKKCLPFPIEGVFSALDIYSQIQHEYENGITKGESTGFPLLDKLYTVRQGEMTIVTGIPSHGKSNLIDAIAINLAMIKDWRFAIFSPENWPINRHVITLMEKWTRNPFAESRAGKKRMSSEDVKEAVKDLNNIFRFIVPKKEIMSVDTILSKTESIIFQFGIKGLIIDPWNEVEHLYGNLREDQYISQKLSDIRRFARLHNIHIWVVAHPMKLRKNDSGGYDPPTMYDISGGAHWRNKADNGLCIHREDFNNNETTVIVQKIRFKEIGKTGECVLKYNYASGGYNHD